MEYSVAIVGLLYHKRNVPVYVVVFRCPTESARIHELFRMSVMY
jgi:hypothetical protein